MSNTELRNGTKVWDAACALVVDFDILDGVWLTVGEVARKAEVSLPTARKYLDIAVNDGICNRVRPFGKGPVYYKPIYNGEAE